MFFLYNVFVKDLKERGIPVDGVGMQLHLDATLNYSEEAIRQNVQRYNDLGVEVSFSEVDVRIPVDKVNEIYNLGLIYSETETKTKHTDDDKAEAICLGLAYIKDNNRK